MRPDTNTCGHMQWFYFSIKNTNKCKVRLSICNNTKPTTLFQRVTIDSFREWNHISFRVKRKHNTGKDGCREEKIFHMLDAILENKYKISRVKNFHIRTAILAWLSSMNSSTKTIWSILHTVRHILSVSSKILYSSLKNNTTLMVTPSIYRNNHIITKILFIPVWSRHPPANNNRPIHLTLHKKPYNCNRSHPPRWV